MAVCFSGRPPLILKPFLSYFPFGAIRYVTTKKGAGTEVFDRRSKLFHRNLAAADLDCDLYEYLHKEIAYRVADRVYDVKKFFDVAVDVGCGRGYIAPHIFKENVGFLLQYDMCSKMVRHSEGSPEVPRCRIVADEELPLMRPQSADLILSSLSIHWINDLPGFFRQAFETLRPDGALIASMFGGDTLYELRCSLQLADQERRGGISPHISPFTQVNDVAALLNRAGFRLLTVDFDEIVVSYPSPLHLMLDLQGMAENNASWRRPLNLTKEAIIASDAIYREMYANPDGSIPATFQILSMIGWSPSADMAKPAKRGSASVSIKDIDKIFSGDSNK